MAQAMEDYYHTEYLTGRNSIGERVRAYKDLQDDSAELEMLFTVDILNDKNSFKSAHEKAMAAAKKKPFKRV